MLFSSAEEFRQYIPATKNIDFNDYKPMIDTAERDDIIPFLSQEQYDVLNAAYNGGSGTLNDAQKNLLHMIRRPLAHIALVRYIAFGNLSIGKSGFTINTPDQTSIASQWRVEDLRNNSLNEYFQGTEQLLKFLEANTGLYSQWAASDAFTQFRECFINTADDFNTYFYIGSSRRTFLSVRAVMKQVEEVIMSITGQGLFDEIKEQILAGSVSPANQKLLNIIKPAVANQTMAQALPSMQIMYTNNGPQLIESSNSLTQVVNRTVDAQRIEKIIISAAQQARAKGIELQNYLYLNHSTYPLFEADSTVYVPTRTDNYNDPDNSTYGFGL